MIDAPPAAASPRRALVVMCAIFLLAGLGMAALGPTLPDLAKRSGRSLADLGQIFVAIFSGALLAQLLGGRSSDRFGRRIVLLCGCTLLAIGTAGIAWSARLPLTLTAGVLYGVGYGGSTLAVNVLASELVPSRRASAVNLVNLFYGFGAIAGPLVAGLFLDRRGSALPAIWLAAALTAIILPVAAWAIPGRIAPPDDSAPRPPAHGSPRGAMHARAFILACGTFLLLYVGAELSTGSWTPVYLQRSVGMEPAPAATATSLFWFALCAGRLLAVLAGMKTTAERLLTISVIGSAAGGLVFWLGHGTGWASLVALVLVGTAFGPIYPTAIAIVTSRFPQMAGAATARIGILASMGGMVIPWVQGLVLTHATTLDSARLTFAVILGMSLMWWVVHRLERRALEER